MATLSTTHTYRQVQIYTNNTYKTKYVQIYITVQTHTHTHTNINVHSYVWFHIYTPLYTIILLLQTRTNIYHTVRQIMSYMYKQILTCTATPKYGQMYALRCKNTLTQCLGLAVLHDAASWVQSSSESPTEGIFPLELAWALTPFP